METTGKQMDGFEAACLKSELFLTVCVMLNLAVVRLKVRGHSALTCPVLAEQSVCCKLHQLSVLL